MWDDMWHDSQQDPPSEDVPPSDVAPAEAGNHAHGTVQLHVVVVNAAFLSADLLLGSEGGGFGRACRGLRQLLVPLPARWLPWFETELLFRCRV